MSLPCCCTSRHFTPPPNTTIIRYPLQPTTPPSIPYYILEPRLEKKHRSRRARTPRGLRVASPGEVTNLDQLVVEDSESEDGRRRGSRKFGEKLNSAYAKLKNGFLQGVNKRRKSHVVFGDSQQEIARRAELKRLMHKRIQDELRGDLQDEKSTGPQSKEDVQNSPASKLAIPGNGPRDCINFTIDSIKISNPSSAVAMDTRTQTVRAEILTDSKKPPSSPSKRGREDAREQRCEKADDPKTSILLEASASSSDNSQSQGTLGLSTSQKSFQLSNGASRLDRILGPENGFSVRNGSSSWDGQSALGVWLIAQGLRSRDSSVIRLVETEAEVPTSHDKTDDPNQADHKLADTSKSRLTSTTETAAEPPQAHSKKSLLLNREGDLDLFVDVRHEKSVTQLTPGASQGDTDLSSSLSDETLKNYPSTTPVHSPVDNASSNYPSVLPSFQASPARSQSNLYRLDPKDIQSLQFSPFEWRGSLSLSLQHGDSEDQGPPDSLQDYPQTSLGKFTGLRPLHRPKRAKYDAASLPEPDTASFVQREAELQSIEKRFGDALSRKRPSKKANSRFREEFKNPSFGQGERSSFISKLYLAVPRRLKTSSKSQELPKNDDDELRSTDTQSNRYEAPELSQVQAPKKININVAFSPNPEDLLLASKPKLDETATDLWQRAIRLEAEERQGSSNRLSAPKLEHKRSISSGRSMRSRNNQLKDKHTVGRSQLVDVSDPGSSCLIPGLDELSPCDPNSHSKWLIQHWVSQMLPETLEQCSETTEQDRMSGKNKLTIPPKSWARYPSHTRDERTKSATLKDNVVPKDFAIKRILPDGTIFWATDKDPKDSPIPDSMPRSLSMKLSGVLREKLSKLRLDRRIKEEYNYPLHGRRGSAVTGGYLEYPELEILPTESGYRDLRALEHEIENMKSKIRQDGSGEQINHRKSIKSLGSRFSALMHEVMEGRHEHDHTPTSEERPYLPETPSSQPHSRLHDSVVLSDVFVTPQSRLSLCDPSSQEKISLDLESSKSEGLICPRASKPEVDLADDRPKSSSWIGEALTELPTISQLDDFRRELENVLQKKSNSSSSH